MSGLHCRALLSLGSALSMSSLNASTHHYRAGHDYLDAHHPILKETHQDWSGECCSHSAS